MKRKRAAPATLRRSKRLKETQSNRGQPLSPLLSLPAELRNQIYEYALSEDNRINITPDLKAPALLQTSKQLRLEARHIRFEKNSFIMTIRNLDSRLCHAWSKFTWPHCVTACPMFCLEHKYNWSNLLEWCRRIHAAPDETYYLLKPTTSIAFYMVIYTAHKIARDYERDSLSWAKCREALVNHYDLIVTYDPQWKQGNETD